MEIIISVFLLFVGIAILVIIHICIVGRAYRREFGIDGVPPIIKGAGMPVDDLKKLPCFEYKSSSSSSSSSENENNNSDNEKDTSAMVTSSDTKSTSNTDTSINNCAVCLECFKVGDTCRMLPNCHHYFHAKCVDVWLTKSPFCPVCRTCTIVATTNKLPSPKVVVASDGGVATVVRTNVPSINNPAAEELC